MNKAGLIVALSEKGNLQRSAAAEVVSTVFELMKEALIAGQRIEIRDFGSWKHRDYPAYTGRNPSTGAPVAVSAKRVPLFTTGRTFRSRLNAPLPPL